MWRKSILPFGLLGAHLVTMVSPSIRHYALLVVIAATWGSSFQAMKISVAEIPPLSIAAGRVLLGAAVVWLFTAIVRRGSARAHVLTGGVRLWVAAAAIAVFNTALPFFLLPWGEQFVGSGAAAILMGSSPMFALVLAHFFTANDRLTPGKVVGMGFGFAGIAVLVGPQTVFTEAAPLLGYGAILLSALSYTVGGILTVRLGGQYRPEILTRAVLVSGAAILLPLALLIDRPWSIAPGVGPTMAVVYLAVFPTAIALLVRFYLIARVGYTFVAQSVYMIPVFGAIWGWVLLAEQVGPSTWLSLGLILFGIAVSRAPLRRRITRQ